MKTKTIELSKIGWFWGGFFNVKIERLLQLILNWKRYSSRNFWGTEANKTKSVCKLHWNMEILNWRHCSSITWIFSSIIAFFKGAIAINCNFLNTAICRCFKYDFSVIGGTSRAPKMLVKQSISLISRSAINTRQLYPTSSQIPSHFPRIHRNPPIHQI